MFDSFASWTASVDGAETAATAGTPASSAFWTISNDARPDTSSRCSASGKRPSIAARPSALSTAL